MLRLHQVVLSFGLVIISVLAEEGEYLTCRQLKSLYPSYESGIYSIYLPSGEYDVYCEMAINGGGYTFLPGSMLSKLSQKDMKFMSTNRADVLLRISKPDGTQPYTVISPYLTNASFSIQASSQLETLPKNKHLGPYIFIDTLPAANQSEKIMAFKSNGQDIIYDPCSPREKVGASYFAFFSNPHEKEISNYFEDNLIYEKVGVAVDWRKTAKRPNSGRRMPLDYFLLTEIHYLLCGCYTSSDRWLNAVSPAHGTAVGFR